LAGLAFGAIQPSNLSDYQTFWALGSITVAYAELRRHRELNLTFVKHAAFWCAVLIGLAIVFFFPYTMWRGEGYGSVEIWQGDKTPLTAYWTIHGLFLFIIVFFLFSETRRWMQRTSFEDIKAFLGPSLLVLAAFVLLLLGAWYLGYPVAIVAMPLILWTGLLMIQKAAEPERRAVLALIGLGLALTVLVEAVVAKGDIGRMNTVFKFYLQVWTFFSIAAGAAVAWLWAQMPEWRSFSRNVLQIGLTVLITVAAMYTVLAASAKVQDRMAVNAPRTLDGMQYMEYAQYADNGQTFDLKGDYDAITWMQENVKGSPVIVELHVSEYKWGNRFTINTGLPGVLGWRNHQAQQRNLVPDSLIWARQNDIEAFYMTFAEADALKFIRTYGVKYIIAGAYEHVFYPPPSFDKFDRMVAAGVLRVAYENDQTKIYEVIK
jgi:YYY domain-containing protein